MQMQLAAERKESRDPTASPYRAQQQPSNNNTASASIKLLKPERSLLRGDGTRIYLPARVENRGRNKRE